jgi:hypothetical protein
VETLFALLLLGLVGVRGYEGDPSQAATAVDVTASPSTAVVSTAPDEPLLTAHAHNDYVQRRPLFDALDRGFTSVEADVWLVDGRLLVGHDRRELRPGRTLERLYLGPLESLARRYGGRVQPGWGLPLRLLIDVKSKAGPSYAALSGLLRRHRTILTSSTDRRTTPRAVTAILSGHRDRDDMRASPRRFAAFEGRLGDLRSGVPRSFMPAVAADWQQTFSWDGVSDMPVLEELRLRSLVAEAHAAGRTLRFWGTPDEPGEARAAVWSMLLDAGVDQVGTDDLSGLATFLTQQVDGPPGTHGVRSAAQVSPPHLGVDQAAP